MTRTTTRVWLWLIATLTASVLIAQEQAVTERRTRTTVRWTGEGQAACAASTPDRSIVGCVLMSEAGEGAAVWSLTTYNRSLDAVQSHELPPLGFKSVNAMAFATNDIVVVAGQCVARQSEGGAQFNRDPHSDKAQTSRDLFVLRYDMRDRRVLNHEVFGGDGWDSIGDLFMCDDGALYIVGSTTSPELLGRPGHVTGGARPFIAKLGSDGSLERGRMIVDHATGTCARVLSAATSGEVFVCGSVHLAADAVAGPALVGERVGACSGYDIFICRVSTDLDVVDSLYVGSAGDDAAEAMALSHENLLVGGSSEFEWSFIDNVTSVAERYASGEPHLVGAEALIESPRRRCRRWRRRSASACSPC
jgi:hypothetical protein